jgi:anti-sigma regulatory factor (Ser/Thr protein kinase)
MAEFERRLYPEAEEVPAARRALRRWLEVEAVPEETTESILVVASELITNGVIHDGGEPITLRVRRAADEISVEVHTRDRPAGVAPYPRPTDDPAETGRGLVIVAALCDEHTFATEGGRRVDCCRFHLNRQVKRHTAGAR